MPDFIIIFCTDILFLTFDNKLTKANAWLYNDFNDDMKSGYCFIAYISWFSYTLSSVCISNWLCPLLLEDLLYHYSANFKPIVILTNANLIWCNICRWNKTCIPLFFKTSRMFFEINVLTLYVSWTLQTWSNLEYTQFKRLTTSPGLELPTIWRKWTMSQNKAVTSG